jgi:ferric-dicitrate binding protein FerR (iron transport regulator)
MSYSDFGTADFVEDPYFQAWVLRDDPQVNAFWELWMGLYPEKERQVAAAIDILLQKSLAPTAAPSGKQIRQAWQQLQHTLEARPPGPGRAAGSPKKKSPAWLPVAMALTAMVVFAWAYWYYPAQPATLTYTSRNSQVLPVQLPDGSQVLLNANSSLTFRKVWQDDQDREVWLKGEAFFTVTRKPLKGLATFTVHAPKVKVQVLGTVFNVADRSASTQVILNAGKINLEVPTTGKPKVLTLRPGDYVALRKKDDLLTRTRVNPEAFSGWRARKLVFNNTPLAEIMGQIEQTYGAKVTLADSRLLNRTFTGTFPNDNLPVLLKTLEKAFQLQVSRQGQNLTFRPAATS